MSRGLGSPVTPARAERIASGQEWGVGPWVRRLPSSAAGGLSPCSRRRGRPALAPSGRRPPMELKARSRPQAQRLNAGPSNLLESGFGPGRRPRRIGNQRPRPCLKAEACLNPRAP
eukprot:10924675-Alexandrium_andersonii.AAC.1